MQLIGRENLESEFLDKLSKLSETRRREFIALATAGGTRNPLPEQVSAAWWNVHKAELAALLLLLLSEGYARSAVQHGMDSASASAASAGWSASEANRLAGELVENGRQHILERARALRSDGLWTPEALDEVVSVDFGRDRLDRLVTTETTRATVRGGETAIRNLGGLSALDVWKLNPGKSASGPCNICRPLGGTTRAHWGPIFPEGPPAHPGCVCELLYAVLNGRMP